MVQLRGRALQPIRPGIIIKEVLAGTKPLITSANGDDEDQKETLVNEACISDLHHTYQALISRENTLRPREHRLRGMTYNSFLKLFKFAQLLGMVKFIREEPMRHPPPRNPLLTLRKEDGRTKYGVRVHVSTRRVFALTDQGLGEGRAWENLCRAWIEQWEIGAAPSTLEAVEERPRAEIVIAPPPVEKPKRVWKHLKLALIPSRRQYMLLLEQLRKLRDSLDEIPNDPRVTEEADKLGMAMADWAVWFEKEIRALKKKKTIDTVKVGEYEVQLAMVNLVSDLLAVAGVGQKEIAETPGKLDGAIDLLAGYLRKGSG